MFEKQLTKSRIAVAVTLCVLIAFRGKFEELANSLLVVPFLSQCISDWKTNVVFVITSIAIVFIYYGRFKRNYLPSWDSLGLVMLITAIYTYYRIENSVWDFIGIYKLPNLKYADLLYLWFAGDLLVTAKRFLTKTKEQPRPLAFALDEPIENLDEDDLDRKQDAKLLAERVRQTQGKYSIAVAVNGVWGSGKTSFMHLIKKYLVSDDVIIMDFNPWLGSDSGVITKDFFESLRSKLKPFSAEIDAELESYSNQFVEVENGWISKSIRALFTLVGTKSLKEQFDMINSTLEKLEKQVVVFIDDLDRLNDSEIQSVLRLIRNTAGFRKLKYVVAFDKAYVEKAIESMNVTSHTSYLDKIFLHLHSLQPVRMEYILDELEKDMIRRFPNQKKEITHSLKDRYKSVNEVATLILTVRDLKRFINQFAVDYEFVEDEVFFPEFLRVQLLKFKFNSIYKLLDERKDEFLEIPDGQFSMAENKVGYRLKRVSGSSHGSDYVLKKYLADNSIQLNVLEPDITTIINLVEHLFAATKYSYRGKTDHLSISLGYNFERYFRNRIFDYNLSDKEFKQMLTLPLEQIQDQIITWVNLGKKTSVVRRFTDVKSENCANREEFEKLIRSIMFLAKCTNPNYQGFQISFDDKDLAIKLTDYNGVISKKFYDGNLEDYQAFVRSVFQNAKSPYTIESGFLRHLIGSPKDFPLTHEEVWAILISYLRDYLSSVSSLDNDCWDLYHKCNLSKLERQTDSTYSHKSAEANEIFIDFIFRTALDDLLFQLVNVEPFDQQKFSVGNIILDLFGSFEAFDELLDKQGAKSHKYIEEFKEFLKIFIENGANKYVSFDFKVIPVHEKIQKR